MGGTRQQFNVGQEIISEDLNSLQSRIERGIYDRIIYEIIQRRTDAFFQNGFKVLFQTATEVLVKAGLGFQNYPTDGKNPTKMPLVLDEDKTISIDTPDSDNPRIDIICVKTGRYNSESEDRKFKDEFTDAISTQSMVVATDWKAIFSYVAGVPSAVPVVPDAPVGFMKISEILVSASTGIASQASISDKRSLLPFAVSTSATGSNEYDAIVGDISQVGVTHENLKSALDNATDGWKILVLKSESVDSIPEVVNDNIEIVFKRGATINRGTSVNGLKVSGEDCRIVNARFSGFNTAGDSAVLISATAKRTVFESPRFLNCETNITDNGVQSFVNVEFTE